MKRIIVLFIKKNLLSIFFLTSEEVKKKDTEIRPDFMTTDKEIIKKMLKRAKEKGMSIEDHRPVVHA